MPPPSEVKAKDGVSVSLSSSPSPRMTSKSRKTDEIKKAITSKKVKSWQAKAEWKLGQLKRWDVGEEHTTERRSIRQEQDNSGAWPQMAQREKRREKRTEYFGRGVAGKEEDPRRRSMGGIRRKHAVMRLGSSRVDSITTKI